MTQIVAAAHRDL